MASDDSSGGMAVGSDGAMTPMTRVPAPGPSRPRILAALAVAVAIASVAAFGLLQSRGSTSPDAAATGSPASSPNSALESPGESGITAGRTFPKFAGTVAFLDSAGAVSVVDRTGRPRQLSIQPGVTFGFPAWSPDGKRIAIVGAGSADTTVSILDAAATSVGSSPQPTVIYRSADKLPFYLYWEPDGEKVSFLANDGRVLALRVAPADGSAPLDGSGPGSVVRRGAPLYFDWVDKSHLLLHVGSGDASFVGEVGLGGASSGTAFGQAGDFRAAVVSSDRRYAGYVRSGKAQRDDIVLRSRTGSDESTAAVYGPAAVVFDPSGTTLATVGSIDPNGVDSAFPLGPLRLLDPHTDRPRVLLDGLVVAFFWSPDGRTIAALRLEPKGTPTAVLGTIGSRARLLRALAAASPSPSPSPTANEVHMLFVDVADGTIRSDRVVAPADRFVRELLPYFDQYALSHRLWSPDSSAFLLPTNDGTRSRVLALSPDGGEPLFSIDSEIAFWSP